MARAGADQRLPLVHPIRPDRWLAEVVDHEPQIRKSAGELSRIPEVMREDDRQLEDESALDDEGKALEDLRLHDPMRIRLIVDQVAHRAELRMMSELRESSAAAGGVGERQPSRHGANPGDAIGKLEQVVGVRVEVGSLDQHSPVDSMNGQRRSQGRRFEDPVDRAMIRRHPRQRIPRGVPEMVMRINDHRDHSEGTRPAAMSVQTGPSGKAYSASDSARISMLYPGARGARYLPSRTTAGSVKCS